MTFASSYLSSDCKTNLAVLSSLVPGPDHTLNGVGVGAQHGTLANCLFFLCPNL
jgi:hypothetical protein